MRRGGAGGDGVVWVLGVEAISSRHNHPVAARHPSLKRRGELKHSPPLMRRGVADGAGVVWVILEPFAPRMRRGVADGDGVVWGAPAHAKPLEQSILTSRLLPPR